jgi:hypothetical protein
MTALHANGVRTVIIEKLDRLASDLMVQETIIADLRKQGFELVSVAEPDLMANDPDGESATLERLKGLRAEGLGFDRIAARMNEEGTPTRTGKPWHGIVVNRILTGKR